MPDHRQSQSQEPNSESQSPPALPKPEDIVDPASPAPEQNWDGIRLFSQLRSVSATERRYHLRRAGVVGLGFSIIALFLLALFSVRALVSDPTGSAAREFSGPFLIQAAVASSFGFFPGGPPILRVSAIPATTLRTAGGASDPYDSAVTVFQIALLEPDRLPDLYAEFVSRQIAFMYFDTLFAVTTNGGHSWQVVTVYEESEKSAVWIDGLLLDEAGHGFLFPEGVESLDSAWLTEDFGHSWRPPE